MAIKLVECEQDGFPVLRINGHQQCMGEFADHCLGRIKITDVALRAGTMYYVFEDGHELPLLCFCCGEPLASSNPQLEPKRMRGRKLKTIGWEPIQLNNGRAGIELQLQFSRRFWEWKGVVVHLSVKSLDQLIHPTTCCQVTRKSPICSAPPQKTEAKVKKQ
jgi:hypothetical protein